MGQDVTRGDVLIIDIIADVRGLGAKGQNVTWVRQVVPKARSWDLQIIVLYFAIKRAAIDSQYLCSF